MDINRKCWILSQHRVLGFHSWNDGAVVHKTNDFAGVSSVATCRRRVKIVTHTHTHTHTRLGHSVGHKSCIVDVPLFSAEFSVFVVNGLWLKTNMKCVKECRYCSARKIVRDILPSRTPYRSEHFVLVKFQLTSFSWRVCKTKLAEIKTFLHSGVELLMVNRLIDLLARIDPKSAGPTNRI